MFRTIIWTCVVMNAGGCLLGEEEQHPAWWSAEVTFKNQHVHRGALDSGRPTAVTSFSARYSALEFTAESVFSRNPSLSPVWIEGEFASSFRRQWGPVEAHTGFLHRRAPAAAVEQPRSFNEIVAGAGIVTGWETSYRLYRDISGGRGWYHDVQTSGTLLRRRRWSMIGSAGIGLSQHLWMKQTAIANARLTVGAEILNSGRAQVTPWYTATVGHRTLFGHHHTIGVTLRFR